MKQLIKTNMKAIIIGLCILLGGLGIGYGVSVSNTTAQETPINEPAEHTNTIVVCISYDTTDSGNYVDDNYMLVEWEASDRGSLKELLENDEYYSITDHKYCN